MSVKFSKLSEVAELIDSLHKTPKYSETGWAMVRCTDVKYGSLNLETTLKVSDEVFSEFSRRYIPRINDIIITRVGSYGITSLVRDTDFCLGQNTSAIIPKINPRYLYLALNSPFVKNQIEFSVVGSTQKTLSLKSIANLDIPRFPLDVETKIAQIIGDLDDKIALNTQTNQTLEQIAQAIFKSWFVDFDPVKAKMTALAAGGRREDAECAAMCAISGKDESALDAMQREQPAAYAELAATAALFPAAMRASELGDVPEGWEVKSLSDMIILTGGGTPKRSEASYWGGQIKWFSVKDVPADGNIFVVDTEEKITDLGLQKSSTKLLRKGTTVITARGTVGKLALLAEDMCMNQSCYGANGNNIGDYFSYFNLREAIATLTRNTHGAVFDTITTKTFDTYRTSFCGAALVERFEITVAAIMGKVESNVRENINLSQLRDSLLPKLLSGEIDLSNLPDNINEANA